MAQTARSQTTRRRTKFVTFLANSFSVLFTLASAAAGGWITYAATVGADTTWRAAAAGIGGLAVGAGHAVTSAAATHNEDEAPTPLSPVDVFNRLADAICADAAQRAAIDSWILDRGSELLGSAEEWEGGKDGTARFELAFDAYVLYQPGPAPESAFRFLAPDSDEPIVLTSLLQLQELLQQLADGDAVETAA
ncbi:hypothetical protein OG762_50435 (plasmid) [Streptomyces sp. NBC_01136]|uniref:hypothetical protein n=1 Tax=Streptomyces sp. NBC_01136 TaxID=2903754 RepID=UPI002F91A863|nr:hypothetical protein OG762_50435 [Streptomyces sp. NBC_01136]